MHLTVALPGLFWQDVGDIDYIYANTKTDNFSHILKHATLGTLDFSYSDLLYSLNEASGSLANHIAQQLDIHHEYPAFLLAEPTHLRLDRDRLLISESELLQLDHDEATNIIKAINAHFAPEVKLYLVTSSLWLIGHNIQVENDKFYSILDIVGENIDDFMPNLQINKLVNEVQMLMHNLPENLARKNEGSLMLNSIWLWDKTVMPDFTAFSKVYTNNLSLLTIRANLIPSHIEEAFLHNNLIIMDKLYHPCYYHDSFGFVDKLNTLDIALGLPLKKWLSQNNTLDIIIPGRDNTIKLPIRRSFKFWQNKQLINLVKEFHAL